MRFALALMLVAVFVLPATGQDTKTVRVFPQGQTDLVLNFVQGFRAEAMRHGLVVEFVDRHAERDYTFVIAQESTFGSAAAAVVALDQGGDLVASVVRSGRLSGKGAINACVKELAKKLAILRG